MQDQQPLTIEDIIKFIEESALTIPGRLEARTALNAVGGWDSMGMVTFITLIKKRTGVRVRMSDLTRCDTPESFLKLVQERLRARSETA